MNHEIIYSGFSASPSDYECPDGSLAASVNLVPEDGALQPVLPPSVVMRLQEGEEVKLIHKTATFTHYIIYSDSSYVLSYVKEGTSARHEVGRIYFARHFNAVGNTLLVFTTEGCNYLVFKDGAYKNLGNHLPDVQLSFGLVGHPRLFSLSDESRSTFTISFDGIAEDALYNELSESNKTRITEQVMARVNKFVAQETVRKGRFCFPFFVRYALRLFDGSLVCHSAPVLMNPSTKAAPVAWWYRATGKHSYTDAECDVMLVASSLDYRLLKNSDALSLPDWSDVITGIEVFISKPIYTYDQSGQITSFADTDNYTTKFIGRLYASNYDSTTYVKTEDKVLGDFSSKEFLKYYCEWTYAQIHEIYYSLEHSHPSTAFHLPEFSDNKVAESLHSASTFYKLCTINIADAVASRMRTDIVIDDEYLQSLTTREVMTDDYLSRDRLKADFSFVYNGRLNLAGLHRHPFGGFSALSMFAHCNGRFNYDRIGNTLVVNMVNSVDSASSYTVRVYIKEAGTDVFVVNDAELDMLGLKMQNYLSGTLHIDGADVESRHSWGCYVFYPNVNAYKLVIGNDDTLCYAIDLRPHDFLNGAYALLDYELVRRKNFTTLPSSRPAEAGGGFPIPLPNKIYTSEVNNPFYFPLLGINTVGTGEIKGICSAAKALSEGQFGQFPLYAFTTEGVWALEVSSTGTYSARQPITRDVCTNSRGITQLDSAVLFPTDRGIMLISGSQTRCISESVSSEYPFDATLLPGFTKLHAMLGHEHATDKCLPTLPFSKFLKQCRMLYDYVHQRVIVYAPGITYAYVFSLKTNQWGMMYSDIASHLNSYPDALAVNSSGAVVNYSASQAVAVRCLYVTRPLKLGAPGVLKTVNTVIQRGFFRKGNVATVLYGSRDLQSWHLVWSSKDHYLRGFRGSPYKYFRIAGIATLSPDENIYGASVEFTPRQTNKPR